MARDPELQAKQTKEIQAYFSKYDSIQEYGVKKHTNAWCIAHTAFKFNLKPNTILGYIYPRKSA